MSGVQTIHVGKDDADQRLDRWLRRQFPQDLRRRDHRRRHQRPPEHELPRLVEQPPLARALLDLLLQLVPSGDSLDSPKGQLQLLVLVLGGVRTLAVKMLV